MCLEQEIVEPANTADHIVPHRGDPDLFWNGELQSLCPSCHSKWKQIEERATKPAIGVDGYPIE